MITELPKPGGDDDGGKTEITPDKGITLYGLVSDKEGNPLEGVVVSDGYSVVASDKKGVYQIVRDPNAKHVFISVPSGYEIPAQANFGSYQGAYQAANSVTGSSSKPYRADFTLSKLAQSDQAVPALRAGRPAARQQRPYTSVPHGNGTRREEDRRQVLDPDGRHRPWRHPGQGRRPDLHLDETRLR